MSKVIAHIDMNCFYASVEEKYNPELKGKPLAIAGEVKTRHGIIVTSNYEARKLGIKTTMRVGDARKIYPNIKILRPDMPKYQQESKRIFDLVREYTDKIEIVSVDEAYIDLSDFHEPIKVIAIIQRRIYKQLGMPSSVGVSFNKFFAKMGSNLKKPLGFSIINKKNYKDILWNLDIGEMHEVILHSLLGVQGLRLKNRANGEGSDELKYTADRKSIGNSKTFTNDLIDEDDILREVKKLSEKVSSRVQSRNYVGNNISIMVRFSDFKTITRSKKIPEFISGTNEIFNYAWELLLEHYDFSRGVRLLGVSLNDIKKSKELKVQLDIFDKKDYKEEERLRKISKKLKAEFGDNIITDFENIGKKEKTVITTSFSKDFLD